MNMHQPTTELQRPLVANDNCTSGRLSFYLSDKADGYMRLLKPEQYFTAETMLDAALRIIEKYDGLTLPIVRGEARSKWIVEVRMEMVVYFREVLGKSYPQIARFMRRDHTSVIHLYQKHRKALSKTHCPKR